MLRFKIICCILIFIYVPKLNAQVYAPDTTFHFQHPKFELPLYQYNNILDFNSKYTIASVNVPSQDLNYGTKPAIVAMDSAANILTSIDNAYYLPNSLTNDGFYAYGYNEYPSYKDSTFVLQYFKLKKQTWEERKIKMPFVSTSGLAYNNGYFTIIDYNKESRPSIYFDSTGHKYFEIDATRLIPEKYTITNFSIVTSQLDNENNLRILVNKEVRTQNNTKSELQYYSLKPNENLTNDKLIFSKPLSDIRLEYLPNSFVASFYKNQIVLIERKIQDSTVVLVRLDLKGNLIEKPLKFTINPNDYYYLHTFENTDYVFLYDQKGKYILISDDNKISRLDYGYLIKHNEARYVSSNKEFVKKIDITTLTESSILLAPKTQMLLKPVVIQVLDNGGFWVGYYNFYEANSAFFAYFYDNKYRFSLNNMHSNIYYLSKNKVLLHTRDAKTMIVDEQNIQTQLTKVEGTILYVDTLYKHIYCNANAQLKRYSFMGEPDSLFHWEGKFENDESYYTTLKDRIIVANDGKLYYKGTRYLANGKLDSTFSRIIPKDIGYTSATPIVTLKKVWNTYTLLDGRSFISYTGDKYQWKENDSIPVLETKFVNFWTEMINELAKTVYRDSIWLKGNRRILPNMEVDSSFMVKSPEQIQGILPNHDLLGIVDNKIYRFTTKNNIWLEFKNLPDSFTMNDSLLKKGYTIEVYTSDGSDVELSVMSYSSSPPNAKIVGNKLYYFGTGAEYIVVKAKSKKGGIPIQKGINIAPVQLPPLPNSTFVCTPKDTILYVDFKPFKFNCVANNDANFPVNINVSGAAYYKDGWIYSTGKEGSFTVRVSHARTEKYESSYLDKYYYAHKYTQEIYKNGNLLKQNQYLYSIKSTDFPLKLPFSASSQLPIKYKIATYYDLPYELFDIQHHTIYLNPTYSNILKKSPLTEYGEPISFSILGYQEGSDKFQPISFYFDISYRYYEESLGIQEFEVFPNPFNFHLYINPTSQGVQSARLFDLNGNLIAELKQEIKKKNRTQPLLENTETNVLYFPTPNIPNGYYLLEFIINDKRYVKRVIKE